MKKPTKEQKIEKLRSYTRKHPEKPANEIIKEFRKKGLSFRREDMLKVIREEKTKKGIFDFTKYYPKNKKIPVKNAIKRKLPVDTKYMTIVKVKGTNRRTGEKQEIRIAVGHNKAITFSDLKDLVEEKLEEILEEEEEVEEYDLEPEEVFLEKIYEQEKTPHAKAR